jgi:hypothetical protein
VGLLKTTFPDVLSTIYNYVTSAAPSLLIFLPTSHFLFSEFLIPLYLFVTWSEIIFHHIINLIVIPL